MDAVEYLREKERMLADKSCQVTRRDMNDNEADYSELAVSLVEQWAKEHLIKTYKDVLLEKFPNADWFNCCVETIFGEKHKMCSDSVCKNIQGSFQAQRNVQDFGG